MELRTFIIVIAKLMCQNQTVNESVKFNLNNVKHVISTGPLIIQTLTLQRQSFT